jgi:hypothetical protein
MRAKRVTESQEMVNGYWIMRAKKEMMRQQGKQKAKK